MSPPMIDTSSGRSEPVSLAIKAAGGVGVLARKLDITLQAVSQWSRIPAARAIEIERITGVDRRILRPDLYPDD